MKHPRSLIPAIGLLLLIGLCPAALAQVSQFGVAKAAYFDQTSDATPVLEPLDNHYFDVWVEPDGQAEIDAAVVNLPGGLGGFDLMPFLFYFEGFDSQAEMDNAYRSGAYRFDVTTADLDFFTASVTLSGNNYPTIPQLLDFSGLQSINTNAALTLRWLPFQGGTANDLISVAIYDFDGLLFETPDFGEPGALDGTATSVVISAGTFSAGPEFDCYLTFNRIVVDSSSGAPGFAIYARETYAVLRTGGAPTVTISGYSMGANGLFQVQVTGTPNATFTLEGTTGFNGWTTVDSIDSPSGTGTLSDPDTGSNPLRFYRVKVL